MLKKTSILSITFFLALMLLLSCSSRDKIDYQNLAQYEHKATKEIVKLVTDAVNLIETEGKQAFENFYKKDSKWFHDDTYIFVWGLDGMRYVYPRDRSGEGKNMLDLKDINGKPIGKMFVEAAKSSNGHGWVFYEWTKPEYEKPIWKSTYIKKAITPDGEKYLVGCGKYNMPMEKIFVKKVVDDAAEFLKQNGREKAFAEFKDKSGKFIFLDTYVFVKNMQGMELVNPLFPELEGKNISKLQDAAGKYFVQEELEKLQNNSACWNTYMWPKPGEDKPSQKIVYIKKVKMPSETLVVGSGYYPEQ
ncbi:MAG: cache domain-containing protein [Candidatus Cloacimonetes bacterium]|nr:cache domain-containing protein [Candidatus Cloacimonadota bacterium]MBS3767909.1 cache domain-containing protein [Candidatus Cloacimonadota bacterium]